MKFTSIALLAVASMTGKVSAQSAIATRWQLDEPVIVYTAASNKFSLDFTGKSSVDNNTGRTEVEFYDRRCQDDGTPGFNAGYGSTGGSTTDAKLNDLTGYKLTAGMGIGDVDDQTILPTWDTNEVEFRIDTLELAQNGKIYDTISQSMITNEAITGVTQADLGFGLMRFCARTEIGYDKTDGTFQDVNFIETLINIKYDLTADFSVAAFSVAPKARIEVTESKSTYLLTAWLCEPESAAVSVIKSTELGQVNRNLPPVKEISVATPFRQGELVTVCVAPDDLTYRDGIQLNALKTFTWTRDNTAAGIANVVQQALPVQSVALSSMVGDCAKSDFCRFSTILFADFYTSAGQVSGAGTADLVFRDDDLAAVRRKLRGDESAVESFVPGRRQLQAETTSPFDLSVDIGADTEGPGAIKTAGGASYGFSALASAVALLSAALLA